MSETLFHPDGRVDVEELPNGKRRLHVIHRQRGTAVPYNGWVTSYPVSLIRAVLAVKGPGYLCDEIRRDEGPSLFDKVLLGHFSERDFAGKRILDFGCGSGGSTVQLARVFPHSQIVGVELVQEFVELARVRASHYGFPHVVFLTSPSETELPADLGMVDFVAMCAVYEHLLPEERPKVLAMLWSHMKPGSVLFLTDTPHRYSPIESHTTHLPFLNYLPAGLALWVARKFARGVAPDESWRALLRRGVRGVVASGKSWEFCGDAERVNRKF